MAKHGDLIIFKLKDSTLKMMLKNDAFLDVGRSEKLVFLFIPNFMAFFALGKIMIHQKISGNLSNIPVS